MSWKDVLPVSRAEAWIQILFFAFMCTLAGAGVVHFYQLFYPRADRFEQGANWMLEKVRTEGIGLERADRRLEKGTSHIRKGE